MDLFPWQSSSTSISLTGKSSTIIAPFCFAPRAYAFVKPELIMIISEVISNAQNYYGKTPMGARGYIHSPVGSTDPSFGAYNPPMILSVFK